MSYSCYHFFRKQPKNHNCHYSHADAAKEMPVAYYLQAESLSEVDRTASAPNNTHGETADKVNIPETNIYKNNLSL